MLLMVKIKSFDSEIQIKNQNGQDCLVICLQLKICSILKKDVNEQSKNMIYTDRNVILIITVSR